MKSIFATLSLLASLVIAAPTPEHFNKLKRAPTGGRVKPNSYIVKLKDNASRTTAVNALNDLMFAFDDVDSFKEVTYSDWSVLNGYAAVLKGKALEFVLADPNVEYVEEDGIVSISWEPEVREASPEAEAEIEADIAARELDARAANGGGVNIYSVDTGVLTTHTSFGGRAIWGATFGGYANRDGNGHGTHTAGSAGGSGFGPATASTIYAVKVLSDSGSGTNSDVISGVNWAVNHAVNSGRPSVVNMSLGGGASTAVDSAVSSGISRGVHFTIAAGNSNVNAANTSPARVTTANTIGAIDSSNRKASFSNYGSVVDVHFLGVSVRSAWIGSNSATNTISGTSMAAPGVAGILAVVLGNNGNQSPAALSSALKANAQAVVTGVPSGTTNLKARLW